MIQKGEDDWNEGLSGTCWGGHINIVQLMIQIGANDWNNGLYGACLGEHINMIELMITNGATNYTICDYYHTSTDYLNHRLINTH